MNKLIVCCSMLLLSLTLASGAAAKKSNKVDICHFDKDAGLFEVITISENAVSKHLSNHGDVFPGSFFADVDGDGFGDPAGEVACPNPGFVDNGDDAFPDDPNEYADSDGDGIGDNGDACPNEAGPPENDGCPAPEAFLGSDQVIGKSGRFGHTGNVGMLFNDGTGGFSMDTIRIGGFEGHEVAVGDLNGDGKDDVVVLGSRGAVSVTLGDFSDGLQSSDFTPEGKFSEVPPNCCDRARVLHLADVNGDGDLDIAITLWAKLGVMLDNGDGTFGNEILSPAINFDARGMALGDLDGDGNLDLVNNYAPGSWVLAVHRGNGDGTFQNGVAIPNSALAIPNIFIRDADGDGDLDVFSGALNARFKIFTNDGSANFTTTTIDPVPNPQTDPPTNRAGGLLVVDDMDGDGAPDVLIRDEGGTTARVYLNDGNGGFSASTVYGPFSGAPLHAVLADVNEDGKADAAMVVSGIPGSVWTLEGNGNGTFQTPTSGFTTTFIDNYTIGAGNFD